MNRITLDAMLAQYAVREHSGDGCVSWENGVRCVIPKVEIGGKAEQMVYTGKNLFDLERRTERTFVNSAVDPATQRDFDADSYFIGVTVNNYYHPPYITNLQIRYSPLTVSFDAARTGFGIGLAYKLTPGEAYALSIDGENTCIGAGFFDEDGNYLQYIYPGNESFVVPSNAYWVLIVVCGVRIGHVDAHNIQFEKGAATGYEPYTGGIPAPNPGHPIPPVFSAGTQVSSKGNDPGFDGGTIEIPELLAIPGTKYRDTWNAQTGVGKKAVEKMVLDGTEDWYKNADFGDYKSFFTDTYNRNVPDGPGACNWFQSRGWLFVGNNAGNFFWVATGSMGFRIHKSFLGDDYDELATDNERIERFKTFLADKAASGAPVTIWIPLKEPILFQTDPQPLIQPPGIGHIIQTGGTLDNCPITVTPVTHQ